MPVRCTLSYGSVTLDLGTVENVSDGISVSTTVSKIPTLPAERAFVMDMGSTESFQVSITRVHPHDFNDSSSDSTRWSNAKWLQAFEGTINRWQADTNGCTFSLIPDDESSDEQAEIIENVYVSSITDSYSSGTPDMLSATLKLAVGSLYGVGYNKATVANDDMRIMISNSDGTAWYYLMDRRLSYNCVSSYSIQGGMNQPFEYIEMKIPRRRLESFAPQLVQDNDIIAGKNQLMVNAVGIGNFIVTRCKLSKDTYTITGYAYSEAFKGSTTSRAYTDAYTPLDIVTDILKRGVTIGDQSIIFAGTAFVTNITESEWSGTVSIPQGSNCWYVLQLCALRMGARIFFAENKAYLLDTGVSSGLDPQGDLDLFGDSDLAQNVVGSASLGDEGTSTVCNVVTAIYSNGSESVNVTSDIENSTVYYGEKGSKSLRMPEIQNAEDAVAVAQGYMKYLSDSQVSIGFTVKETDGMGWNRCFEVNASASSIQDEVDEIEITNVSNCNGTVMPQLLTQSMFERTYPDGSTTYWFGVQQQSDLTQMVSQILTSINNG